MHDLSGLAVCIAVTTVPVIERFPGAITVEEGQQVEFKVFVNGNPQPSYKWYHDGQRIEEDYAHEVTEEGCLIVVTAEQKHNGAYKLVAENVAGVTEKSVTLVVIHEKMDDDTAPLTVNDGSATAPGQLSLDAIPVAEFGQYVANCHADNNKGFQSLYNVSGLCLSVCFCVCICPSNSLNSVIAFSFLKLVIFLPHTNFFLDFPFRSFFPLDVQSLNGREGNHPVTVAVTSSNKPFNRFTNITVCE